MFRIHILPLNDQKLTGRLTRAFQAMMRKGDGETGMRAARIREHKEHLLAFRFQSKYYFNTICLVPVACEINRSRTSVNFSVPAFNAKTLIVSPKGSTHFRFTFMVGILSDLTYALNENRYVPVQPEHVGYYNSTASPMIERTASTETMKFSLKVPKTSVNAVLACVEIVFYPEDNDLYPLISHRALVVLDVF